ncbi:hypothetical protein BKA61DRAFT_739451 [Leptodontidium sp. MPI-SDFR-AT-0119]|nr:hypothetical protein BKA61DRAFT_739451 [Leptodontidium sp. MPI-SDFR-AT-0119]
MVSWRRGRWIILSLKQLSSSWSASSLLEEEFIGSERDTIEHSVTRLSPLLAVVTTSRNWYPECFFMMLCLAWTGSEDGSRCWALDIIQRICYD